MSLQRSLGESCHLDFIRRLQRGKKSGGGGRSGGPGINEVIHNIGSGSSQGRRKGTNGCGLRKDETDLLEGCRERQERK